GHVGTPNTFRISSQSRYQQYQLECDVGQNFLDLLNNGNSDLDDLLQRLTALENRACYRLEILEENNSKVIFVFTVVTVIFLPLSCMTSYMGMNTVDIRNMGNSQATFWAAALPITGMVLFLAILVAYKGGAVREWFFEVRERRKSSEVGGSQRQKIECENTIGKKNWDRV